MNCIGLTKKKGLCGTKCKYLFCKNHRYQYWSLVVVIATISTLFKNVIFPASNLLGTNAKKSANQVVWKNADSFKVLVLPFNPDKNCVIEESKYEEQIVNRINEELQDFNHVESQYNASYNCPNSLEDIINIGKSAKADFVVWGNYLEECDGNSNLIRIKYKFISQEDGSFKSKEIGDTGYEKLENLTDLSKGLYQGDMDFLIQRANAYNLYIKNDNEIEVNEIRKSNLFSYYEGSGLKFLTYGSYLKHYYSVIDNRKKNDKKMFSKHSYKNEITKLKDNSLHLKVELITFKLNKLG